MQQNRVLKSDVVNLPGGIYKPKLRSFILQFCEFKRLTISGVSRIRPRGVRHAKGGPLPTFQRRPSAAAENLPWYPLWYLFHKVKFYPCNGLK